MKTKLRLSLILLFFSQPILAEDPSYVHELSGFTSAAMQFQASSEPKFLLGGSYSRQLWSHIQATARTSLSIHGSQIFFSPLVGPTFNLFIDEEDEFNEALYVGVLFGFRVRNTEKSNDLSARIQGHAGFRLALNPVVSWKPEIAVYHTLKRNSRALFEITLVQFSVFL